MSGLRIYYSDRIEDLAGRLTKHLLEERSANADMFEFSQVAVPNTNIAKWLRIRELSSEPSLCMGVEFPFIEQSLFNALADRLGPKRPSLLPMNAYANAIAAILLRDDDVRLAPFRRYIAQGATGPLSVDSRGKARMTWQLAVKLADLMDRYEVHRRKIVEKWLDKRRAAEISDPTELAEAALAQKLFGDGGVYPRTGNAVSLRQLFELVKQSCGESGGKTRKMHFFGFSTLSSLQVDIIHLLARTHDVYVYHNNVCLEYWGDIETEKESARRLPEFRSRNADEDIDVENALLRSWGRAGRETLRLLVDLEESNGAADGPIDFEWNELPSLVDDGETMLAKVQASVRRRVSEVGRVRRQDASIQIVGAPGIRREVEMVYNAILGAVWKPDGSGDRPWSDCSFSDIAVLVPDMKRYRPVIESVFDARGEVPYGLIDTSVSEYSRYLEGFMALVSLSREGLSRETIFAVLDNSCVQRALGFTAEDVREWRRCTKEIGAFDGFEGEADFKNVSWECALSRLRLGTVAKDGPGLTVREGGDDSALKFSEIVETLHRELAPLAGKRLFCTPSAADGQKGENWADTLRRIAGGFLSVGSDDELESAVCGRLFRSLYALDMIEGEQTLDFVVAAVEEFVHGIKCRSGGYLTHGVTIAGLQPMRPVPFKQVFMLGMGEGMFPGRDGETTLEIRGAARTLGDTGATAADRYLFLETLMSTRERLVISYPDLDVVKDAELFPSGMVRELEEFLEKNVLPSSKDENGKESRTEFREIRLPLLERGEEDDLSHGEEGGKTSENPVGPIRWSGEYHAGVIPTYSNVERAIAWRIGNAPDVTDPEIQSGARDGGTPDRIAITAGELAEFLEAPLRTTLRRRHGIAVEGHRDDSLDPDAPIGMTAGPTTWDFKKSVLKKIAYRPDGAVRDGTDVESVFNEFAGRGYLPDPRGMLGGYALKREQIGLTGDEACRERLGAVCAFVRDFFPPDARRPAPVRTLLPLKRDNGEFRKKFGCREILYTGQTSDRMVSEDSLTSFALVYGPCGDKSGEKKKKNAGVKSVDPPPRAVLEPFVAWLITVMGAPERKYSLRTGIVDMGQLRYAEWNWSVTPKEAMEYVERLTAAYLKFLDEPDDDGCYLDFGYSETAKALAAAVGSGAVGDVPPDKEGWAKVVDVFPADGFRSGGGGFNSGLVVERTVEALSRAPEERDASVVKDRFEDLFRLPMGGVREESRVKVAQEA